MVSHTKDWKLIFAHPCTEGSGEDHYSFEQGGDMIKYSEQSFHTVTSLGPGISVGRLSQ